jgi:nitrate reductase gamma subunit
MDIAVLLILLMQLILGLISIYYSANHPDGSMMVAWASWAQHIVTFRAGAADFVRESDLVFKLHVLLGLSIFLIFPFTRLVHVWSAPIWYLFRRQYQIVRSKKS